MARQRESANKGGKGEIVIKTTGTQKKKEGEIAGWSVERNGEVCFRELLSYLRDVEAAGPAWTVLYSATTI
jgi:hypothetical protein